MANVLIFFVGFIIAVVIGQLRKVNPGFIAIFFGLLINWFILDGTAANFVSLFPVTLFWNLAVMMTFYGFASANGTMTLLGQKIVYTFRNAKWAIVIVIFLTTTLVSASGASLTASLIMAPLAWGLCMQAGVTPLLIPFATWTAEMVGGFLPWTTYGAINLGYFSEYLPEENGSSLLYSYAGKTALFCVVAFIIGFFVMKGWKTKENEAVMTKPEAFNAVQKKTLFVILACILLLLIPTLLGQFVSNAVVAWMQRCFSMPTLGAIGIAALSLMKCGDLREVCSKRVGWYAIWTVVGMAMYCALAQGMGVIETLGNALQVLPAGIIAPAIYTVAAILTFFVTPNAFQPFLFAMVPALASAAGCSVHDIVIPMLMGCLTTAFSPFTASGINNMVGAPQEVQSQVINKMAITAAIMGIAGLILTALGLFGIGG